MSETKVPLVSIITVVRNNVRGINRALKSVLEQNLQDFEYFIVDGCSTDGTVESINRIQDPRLTIISEPDCGIYDAMNKGVALARGRWLFFLGSDDALADPSVLMDMLYGRDISDVDIVFGRSCFENGECFTSKLDWRINLFNTIHHQSAFYSQRLFEGFRFRKEIGVVADYELNYRAHRERRNWLFVDRKVSTCSSFGVSHTSSQFAALFDLATIRRSYIGPVANTFLLTLGMINLAADKSRKAFFPAKQYP